MKKVNKLTGNTIRTYLIIAVILLSSGRVLAQSSADLYSTITEEKWLPSNSVRVIFQDSKGFMWVGTNSGLFRYNLYSVLNINLTQKASGRLLNNTIHAIAEDTYGNILVGTESGLGVIDANSGECTVLSSTDETVTRIIAGKNNLIWIATGNGDVYRIVAQPYKNYRGLSKPFTVVKNEKGNRIGATTIFEMPDGSVLLGTSEGIYTMDISRRRAVPTKFKHAVTRIYSFDFSHLFVGTDRNGLFLLDFSGRNQNNFSVSPVTLSPAALSDHIVNVSGISKQNIVTASWNNVYIAERNNMMRFKKIGPVSLNQKLGAITYLYVDRTANIWLGSTRGLYKLKRQSLLLSYYEAGNIGGGVVNSLLNDGRGNLWAAAMKNGLHVLNFKKNVLDKVQIPFNDFRQVKKTSSGTVLVISDNNLIEISPGTGSGNPAYKLLKYRSNAIQDLQEIEPGEWWLATWKGGLIRYIEKGKEDSLNLFTPLQKQIGNEVPVFCITKDSRQRVWIGTRGKGIYRLDLATGNISHLFKKGNEQTFSSRILCIFEDSKKRVWIGTRGDGLLKYSPETDDFVKYELNSGLPSNSICAVEENTLGEIWVATLNGVALYQPDSRIAFQSYNIEDGIASSEFSFNVSARGDNGEVYFGNGSGFYSFRKSINPSHAIFPAVFTNFEIYSKEKSSPQTADQQNSNELLQMLSSGRVVLGHDQNSFGISFSALDFTNPDKNRYLYRLVGLDSTWKFIQGAKATVPYYDLPAGEYVFELLSSNSQGEWNEKPVTVKLRVEPYIWLSTPAYILYVIIISCLFIAAYIIWMRWFNLRKRLQQEREMAQKQSQQMVLYTDLSHEIKNRLSLILGPLELALSDKKVNRAILNNLYNQAQRLKRLNDQILNIRKTESGGFILNVSEENIFRLLERLYSESQPLATIKDVGFTFKPMKETLLGWCDEELLEIIIMNLLGNAIKYVNIGGKVEMKADIEYLGGEDLLCKGVNEGNYLVLSVFNTGDGIPQEEVSKVTQLFYRSSNSKSNDHGGAGIGLNLVARLVHLHHGCMEILSETGELTAVTIQIPIDKFQYSISELKPNMITSPIILPAGEKEQQATEDEKKTEKNGPVKKSKILVVDDKPELAELVKNCLKADFDVYTSTSGKKAMDILQDTTIEMVISDLVMPEMDGLTLCLSVRSDIRFRNIPFIILTGRNSEEQKLICFQNGVDDFIEKPFSPELLKWKVKSILRSQRLADHEKKNIVIVTPGAEISESPEESFIQKIVNIIEENIDKDFLDADFLAGQSFMSRATFYRKMEGLVGESPSVFIRKYRLKKAAKLLLSRHYNVSSVAGKVGFKDPKYFTKCFQKEFGLSPSEYPDKQPDKPTA